MKIEQVFKKYLSEKYFQVDMTRKDAGPVITISRDTGCYAGRISRKLIEKINQNNERIGKKEKWNYINKEILEKVADELQISLETITRVFESKKSHLIEDMANSLFTRHFVSDSMIISTIKYIIKSFAYEGNVVIIGRAASIITHEINNSLHIKLYAPKPYREKRLMEINQVSQNKAKEIIKNTDSERETFIRFFLDKKPELEYYDSTINSSRFEEDQIVDMIYYLAVEKCLIKA